MKTVSRIICLGLILALVVNGSPQGQVSPPAVFVNVDEIQGLTPGGGIPIGGTDLVIPVRFINVDESRTAISNGYKFTGDVTFSNLTAAWNPEYPWTGICYPAPCYPYFDLVLATSYFLPNLSQTEITTDAIGVGMAGVAGYNQGLPATFDGIAYYITLSDVSGLPGAFLTLDTTWWKPANYWIWVGVPEPGPDWGGPYTFMVWDDPGEIYTECWPQPTVLQTLENDRILEVYVYRQDPYVVDMASVRVNGIPNYLNDGIAVWDADNERIWTNVFIMRFLGASGFRPIPQEGIQSTYNVTYNTTNAGEVTVTGDYVLNVYPADVTFDGQVNIDDVVLLVDYLFRSGKPATLFGENLSELMDVDGSGRFDLFDVQAAIDIAGI